MGDYKPIKRTYNRNCNLKPIIIEKEKHLIHYFKGEIPDFEKASLTLVLDRVIVDDELLLKTIHNQEQSKYL